MPAYVELVIGREDAAVEDLERRLEQRRPRALQDHRVLLREGRRQRALPRSAGQRQLDRWAGPGGPGHERKASGPGLSQEGPSRRNHCLAYPQMPEKRTEGYRPFSLIPGMCVGFLCKKVDLHAEKVPAMLPGMDKVAQATKQIGQRLRSARAGAGFTLASVARQAGLSESFLSRLERGQVVASIANLIQLAEVLGLGLHELFQSTSAPAR